MLHLYRDQQWHLLAEDRTHKLIKAYVYASHLVQRGDVEHGQGDQMKHGEEYEQEAHGFWVMRDKSVFLHKMSFGKSWWSHVGPNSSAVRGTL